MAKRKTVRKLVGLDALAGLATMGVMGARSMARSREAARRAAFAPSPERAPRRDGKPKTLDERLAEMRDEAEWREEFSRRAKGQPAISPEEHAGRMHDLKGVRDSSDIPIRAGDGILQETNPSMRPVIPADPALRPRVGFGLRTDHYLGENLNIVDPATDSVDRSSFGYKKGGEVKSRGSRSSVSNASRRGDGIAIRGKTKGRML